jgi:hypothetical protein
MRDVSEGLGGQVAPTTGGLYAIAALATLTGLFSRHALDKLKEIFNVALASQDAADNRTTDAGTTDAGTTGAETNGRRHNGYRHNGYRLAAYPSAHRTGSGPQQHAKPNNGGVARRSGKGSTACPRRRTPSEMGLISGLGRALLISAMRTVHPLAPVKQDEALGEEGLDRDRDDRR